MRTCICLVATEQLAGTRHARGQLGVWCLDAQEDEEDEDVTGEQDIACLHMSSSD
jgi:hypothetical protein